MDLSHLASVGIRHANNRDLQTMKEIASPFAVRMIEDAGMTFDSWASVWMGEAAVACIAGEWDGKLLCLGSFLKTGPRTLQSCLLPTQHIAQYPLAMLRGARAMHQVMFDAGWLRITTCGPKSSELDKWHWRLGYGKEGYHPKALHNGGDAVTWGNLGEQYGH